PPRARRLRKLNASGQRLRCQGGDASVPAAALQALVALLRSRLGDASMLRKVLIGCGIASALCLALVVVVGIVIGSYVKKRLPDIQHAGQLAEDMKTRYGRIDSFVPPL